MVHIKKIIAIVLCCYSLSGFAREVPHCPNGGKPDMLHGRICCKDGFAEAFDYANNQHTGIYNWIDAPSCGCPKGGEPTRGLGIQMGCCSPDHYAWNPNDNDYTGDNAWVCGCPDGGEQVSVRDSLGNPDYPCCKDGYGFTSREKGYSTIIPYTCGCPNGGTVVESDKYEGYSIKKVCCKDGYNIDDKGVDYTNIAPARCGCPEGWIYQEEHNACCNNGMRMLGKRHTHFQPETCGCPNGGVYQNNKCLLDGYEYNQQTKKYDISVIK